MTQIVILGCAVIFFAAGGLAFRNYARLVRKYSEGAPPSTIAQARGFAQISGVARAMSGAPTVNPLTRSPCVWYAEIIESDDRSAMLDPDRASRDPILMDDGTGACAVTVNKLPSFCEREVIESYSTGARVVRMIRAGTRLYAIGRVEQLAVPDRGATHRLVGDEEFRVLLGHQPLERTVRNLPLMRKLSIGGFVLAGLFFVALVASAYLEWGRG
jgi:hypothetical protein